MPGIRKFNQIRIAIISIDLHIQGIVMITRNSLSRALKSDSFVRKITATLDRWNVNFTSRKHLLELSDEQLSDIGIDRKSAIQEGRKMFWQK